MPKPFFISTVDLPWFRHGGLVTKALVFARIARGMGFSPVLIAPSLERHITLKRRLRGIKPVSIQKIEFEGFPLLHCGARFPEWESNAHHFDPVALRAEIPEGAPCFAVSGSNHAARPYLDMGLPYSVWPSSTFLEDCKDRLAQTPWGLRKLCDHLDLPKSLALERRIFESSTLIAADTHYTRKQIESIHPSHSAGKPSFSAKIRLIPIPVDTDRLQPAENGGNRQNLVFIGRLSDPRKNLGLLLDAFEIVGNRNPDATLTLAGRADETLLAKLKSHARASRIEPLPSFNEDQKAALLQKAALFILPSHQEGFGIVATEAMACGIPVISTRCGGPEDFVLNEETGLLLDQPDPRELADKILRLLSHRSLQQRLGRQARELMEKKFSFHAVRPMLESFIHDSLEKSV